MEMEKQPFTIDFKFLASTKEVRTNSSISQFFKSNNVSTYTGGLSSLNLFGMPQHFLAGTSTTLTSPAVHNTGNTELTRCDKFSIAYWAIEWCPIADKKIVNFDWSLLRILQDLLQCEYLMDVNFPSLKHHWLCPISCFAVVHIVRSSEDYIR